MMTKIEELKAKLTETKSKQEINNRNYEQEMYNVKSDTKDLIKKQITFWAACRILPTKTILTIKLLQLNNYVALILTKF